MMIYFTFIVLGTIGIISSDPIDRAHTAITANNLFSARIYKEVLNQNAGTNFIVSPFSAATVLAMVESGAKGETGGQLRAALNLPDDQTKIEHSYKALLSAIKSSEGYTLNSANKIYAKKGFSIKKNYKKIAIKSYKSSIESIDFFPQVTAAETINKWVEEKTNNKIQNLVKPDVLNNLTRLVLVNALYLKADWRIKFDLPATSKKDFYKTANDVVKVDTMHETNYYKYYESTELNAKFLEFAFENEDASLVVILPNEKEGLSALEKKIERPSVEPKFTTEYVNVALPKFKIDTKTNFVDVLKNLGVTQAFDQHTADFSGISGKPGDLFVSDVLQKAFIDVNENGVEAAAATYVAMAFATSLIEYPEPKPFIADHPFIFYIKVKGVVLFVGRVVSPN